MPLAQASGSVAWHSLIKASNSLCLSLPNLNVTAWFCRGAYQRAVCMGVRERRGGAGVGRGRGGAQDVGICRAITLAI